MTSYEKHTIYLKKVLEKLKSLKISDKEAKDIITDMMFYMDKHHLHDKHYIKHHALFLACEHDPSKLKNLDAEIYISFLTTIYRIDYIDPNSDAFMIYYKQKMIERILEYLILKLETIKGA